MLYSYICLINSIIFLKLDKITIIDMENNQEIKPRTNFLNVITLYKKGHFYYEYDEDILYIYSTKLKNNEFICKSIYSLPKHKDYDDIEVEYMFSPTDFIAFSKYDRIYFRSSYYIYVSNIYTEKCYRIYVKNARVNVVMDNEDFICLRTYSDIIIYSIEFETVIATVDHKNGIFSF